MVTQHAQLHQSSRTALVLVRRTLTLIILLAGFGTSGAAAAATCHFLRVATGTGSADSGFFIGTGFERVRPPLMTVTKMTDNVEHPISAVPIDENGRVAVRLSRFRMIRLGLDVGVEVIVRIGARTCTTRIVSGLLPSLILSAVTPSVFEGDVRRLDRLPVFTAGQGESRPWVSQDLLSGPLQNFDGVRTEQSKLNPVGDVGPNHYVQMINAPQQRGASAVFAVYDKQRTLLAGPTELKSLWPREDRCSSEQRIGSSITRTEGDPIVLYDLFADRWLLSQMATGYLCVAVSTTRIRPGDISCTAFPLPLELHFQTISNSVYGRMATT